MLHRHHIIPRHAGGTDDPSNIALLTIEEHAEAHRILYEKYGRWQDKLAWQMLSGQIGKISGGQITALIPGHMSRAGKIGGKNGCKIKKSRAGKISGKIGGKATASIPGHMSRIGKVGGEKGGEWAKQSGHCKRIAHLGGMYNMNRPENIILCFDKNGNFIQEFSSQKDAAKKLGLSQGNINATLNGKRNHTGGYTFRYKN